MGCWGIGSFENDGAMDWVGELERTQDLAAVARVLCTPRNGEYVEVDEGSASLAAAEVVAALLGKPSSELPLEVARWISEHRGLEAGTYRENALSHARAILSGNSELRALWEQDESEFPFWKARVEALIARLGADLMVRALAALSRGVLDTVPQDEEGVTYAHKIDKAETRIDWSRAAAEVHNHIRGLSPDPGAWFAATLGKSEERIKVLRSTLTDGGGTPGSVLDENLAVACGSGAVRLIEVQRGGKQPMKAAEFLRGLRTPLRKIE